MKRGHLFNCGNNIASAAKTEKVSHFNKYKMINFKSKWTGPMAECKFRKSKTVKEKYVIKTQTQRITCINIQNTCKV